MNSLYVSSAVVVGLMLFVVNTAALPQHLPCLGCPSPVDVNSTNIIEVAGLAVTAVKTRNNSPHPHRLIRVVEGTHQVVSGHKYVLTIEVGHDEPQGDDTLQVTERCQVEIWQQSWLNKNEVTVNSCNTV